MVQNPMPRLSNKIYYLISFWRRLPTCERVSGPALYLLIPAGATRRSPISHNVRRYIYQGRYSS